MKSLEDFPKKVKRKFIDEIDLMNYSDGYINGEELEKIIKLFQNCDSFKISNDCYSFHIENFIIKFYEHRLETDEEHLKRYESYKKRSIAQKKSHQKTKEIEKKIRLELYEKLKKEFKDV